MRFSLIRRAATLLLPSLFLGIALGGCGSADEGLGACPPGSTAAEAAGHNVVRAKCETCHSSKQSGTNRFGAPEDLNYDNLETVRAEAAEMYEEIVSGAMPPDPALRLAGTDLENVRIWLACGAKETAP